MPTKWWRTEKRQRRKRDRLMRMGVFSALAIAIHNFPEGLATFMAALANPTTWHQHRRRDRHPQHPGRRGGIRTDVLRHGKPPEGVHPVFPFRPGGTRWRADRFPAYCARLSIRPPLESSSRAWRGSWCISHWTNSCRPPRNTASTTSPSAD